MNIDIGFWTPIITSFVLALLGYLKSREKEDFSGWKFMYTVFWGVVIAILSTYFGLPINAIEDQVMALAAQVGLIEFTALFFKALWVNWLRDVAKKLFPWLWQENLPR